MKDIYDLLNRTKNDYPKAEPLTNEEVNAIMKRFRNDINPVAKESRKKKKTITIVTAVIMAACCGVTALAADRLGVFDNLVHKQDMTFPWYDDGTEISVDKFAVKYDYEKIAEAAYNVTDTVTAESEGLTIRVDSVYCDGQTLMIGISGSMKDGNPEHKNLIKLYPISMNINGRTYNNGWYDNNRSFASLDGSLVLDEGTDNRFSGSIDLIVFDSNEITDTETVEIRISGIQAMEHYMDKAPVDLGKLSFSADVTPDRSLRECGTYTITEDGYSVRFYEISPAMMIVGFASPDTFADEGGCNEWLFNEKGERIERIDISEYPEYGDGYGLGVMVPVTSGSVTAKFGYKKNIDRNGDFTVTEQEININMDEVYAALKENG